MIPSLLLALLPLQDPGATGATGAAPRIEGFRFAPDQQRVGTVYHYRKSNVDGSNPSHVDVYVASGTRIEAYKYHQGASQGTLVTAEMDWQTFSVGRFETGKLFADGTEQQVGTLEVKGNVLHMGLGKTTSTVVVERFPWHTYDFDLTSLNMSLRYLTDPEGVVLVGMVDPVLGRMKYKGFVELAYLDDELRGEVDCRHYTIDGPGLNDRGGELWVRKGADPVIVDYEIDLPDEPGMKSGKMLLLGTEEFTAEAWLEHKQNVLK